jgi:hypothetical protein
MIDWLRALNFGDYTENPKFISLFYVEKISYFVLQRGGSMFCCIEVFAAWNHDTTRCKE